MQTGRSRVPLSTPFSYSRDHNTMKQGGSLCETKISEAHSRIFSFFSHFECCAVRPPCVYYSMLSPTCVPVGPRRPMLTRGHQLEQVLQYSRIA